MTEATAVEPLWRLAVDTGGTFTDAIAQTPDHQVVTAKVLSSGRIRTRMLHALPGGRCSFALAHPNAHALVGATITRAGRDNTIGTIVEADSDHLIGALSIADHGLDAGVAVDLSTNDVAPVLAARLLTATPVGQEFPSMIVRLATTRGTNALLEQHTAPTALFVTRGFGDLLHIGDQRRPDLFALHVVKRQPITDHVVEIDERISADGQVVMALDRDAARRAAQQARAAGAHVAAIALLNAWANGTHEQELEAILREAGFEIITVSSDIAPAIKLLDRAETAAVNAALEPVVGDFLDVVASSLGDRQVHVMTSAGGIVDRRRFRPADSLLSGPAGGVVGARAAGARANVLRIISFDMGGTSTDVARITGDVPYTFEHAVNGIRIARPAVDIETVAAGGGSICGFRDGRPFVGPMSASADPGPACYGAGGPLTLTDVNLLLGRIDPARFEIPIDLDASTNALNDSLHDLAQQTGERPSIRDVLHGFLELADERMADAIRRVSVRRGYEPADHTLVAFGGAGPQHACSIAERLGITHVRIPLDASILSAVGVLHSPIERIAERTVLEPLNNVHNALDALVATLRQDAIARLAPHIRETLTMTSRTIISLRFLGQDHAVDLENVAITDLDDAFRQRYQDLFQFVPSDRGIECVSVRVAVMWSAPSTEPPREAPAMFDAAPSASRDDNTAIFNRDDLTPGACLSGPSIVMQQQTASIIAAGWTGLIDPDGTLVLSRDAVKTQPTAAVHSTVMSNELTVTRLTAIAERMGEQLRRTAVSANVRERLDFSCAVLDPSGRLVASAPHIPVHLSALGACTRHVLDRLGTLAPGDVAITNHPRDGGSHLPDVTLVQPVHDDDGTTLLGYVASRAHHAEVGGMSPGSMPPGARCLAEEGVVIPAMRLITAGTPQWDDLRCIFCDGPYPTRAYDDNVADIAAALAAGQLGADALRDVCSERGIDAVHESMSWIIDHTRRLVRQAFESVHSKLIIGRDALDDGSPINVRIDAHAGGITIDFEGSAPLHAGNFNAPRAVVYSAVAYVARLLVDRPIPLNEGLLEAIDIRVPAHSMLDPRFTDDPALCPAVAAGNVETSQRIVNVLLHALGRAADSQGTMNNLVFGNASFGSYETICGGTGATPLHDGTSAIHSHMTNTAIADAEIIERRYPVRVRRFSIRRDSGGAGAHIGGDGVIRELEMLEPVQLSVIGEHRVAGPRGLHGGHDGKPGRQHVVRADGRVDALQGSDQCSMQAGDRIVIETPGGGGYGTPPDQASS
ncbi:MAG: hydantoinase B/oxoprolinase family protein [Planctomycetota bacterium]